MRAVVLHGREDARLEEAPIPPVGPGEIRLRIEAALTCGTDLKVFRRGYHARMIVPPAIFGHESCGVVDAAGPGVTDWRLGERAVALNSAPCGDCFYCAIGREELCEDLLFLNGAYAEFITVPERIVRRNLLRVPDGMNAEQAALTEPLACALLAVEQSAVRPGEQVAILGAGPLGLLLARACVLAGASVLVVGRREGRLSAARAMGAPEVLDLETGVEPAAWVRDRTAGRGADCVIEAVGKPEAWETAIRMVRKGGRVNLFGGCPAGTEIRLNTGRMHYDAITLLGTFHHTPAIARRALELLSGGHIPAEVIIQDRTTLDDLPGLLPRLAQGGGPLKVAVRPL